MALGLRSDLELEIKEGVVESDVLVATPEAAMKDGEAVRVVK